MNGQQKLRARQPVGIAVAASTSPGSTADRALAAMQGGGVDDESGPAEPEPQ
jgi:hypothetical protein